MRLKILIILIVAILLVADLGVAGKKEKKKNKDKDKDKGKYKFPKHPTKKPDSSSSSSSSSSESSTSSESVEWEGVFPTKEPPKRPTIVKTTALPVIISTTALPTPTPTPEQQKEDGILYDSKPYLVDFLRNMDPSLSLDELNSKAPLELIDMIIYNLEESLKSADPEKHHLLKQRLKYFNRLKSSV